jgi:hypothetical protein
MRKMRMWLVQTLLLAGLLLAHPVAAAAGGIYRWTTADGTVAFTDDPKRIPARYRQHAVAVPAANLEGYRHFTPESAPRDSASTEAYLRRLDARIDRLSAINASEQPAIRHEGTVTVHGTRTVYGLTGGTAVSIPNGTEGAQAIHSDKPLVVEQARVRDPNGSVTRHVTVIRQGDRIISVVEGEATESSASWPRYQQLTGDE